MQYHLVHLAGLRFQVLVKGDLEVKELVAVGAAQLAQMQAGSRERVVNAGEVVKEKAGAGRVRSNDRGAVLEDVEVLLDLRVAGLWP